MDLFEIFNQNWLGTLFGLIGVILAIWGSISVRRSKIGPLPVYETRSIRLISKQEKDIPNEVEIFFDKKEVPRLTRTYILFWNDGTSTIEGKNIIKDDKLRVEIEDNEQILKSSVIKYTKKTNKATSSICPRNTNIAHIDFDYLDAGDGVLIELLHTSKKKHPVLSGTIKGVPNGIKLLSNIGSPLGVKVLGTAIQISRPLLRVTAYFGLILLLSAFLPESFFRMFSEPSLAGDYLISSKGRFALMLIGGMYSLFPLLLLWSMRRRYPKKLYIDELGGL